MHYLNYPSKNPHCQKIGFVYLSLLFPNDASFTGTSTNKTYIRVYVHVYCQHRMTQYLHVRACVCAYRTLASLPPPLLKRNFALKRGAGVTTRTAYISALLRPRSLRSSIAVIVLYHMHTYAAFRKGTSEHI